MHQKTFQQILFNPAMLTNQSMRMQVYPLLLASAIIDAGGQLELSQRAFGQACQQAENPKTAPQMVFHIQPDGRLIIRME